MLSCADEIRNKGLRLYSKYALNGIETGTLDNYFTCLTHYHHHKPSPLIRLTAMASVPRFHNPSGQTESNPSLYA